MRNNTVLRIGVIILLSLLVTACSSEPRKYDFAVSVAGGPEGWPVWVEEVIVDQSWRVPAGGIEHGFDQHPPMGGVAVLGPKPAPSKIYARWFSHRTEKFYEVTLSLPEDLDDKLRKWYRDYPRNDYIHTLIVGFSGKGEALGWWEAFCNTCNYDRSNDFSTPLVENVKGEVVDGDPGRYNVRTGEHVERGTIPPPPMWLIRQSDGDAGN